MKAEAKRERKDLTGIFLKNYRKIRQSCDEQILERIKYEEDYYESFDWFCRLMQDKDPDTLIEQMEKASCGTEQILCRIDRAMEDYAEIAKRQGIQSWRQYDSVYSIYFSNSKTKIKDLARKYGVKKSTIYRDVKMGKNVVNTLLFGKSDTV